MVHDNGSNSIALRPGHKRSGGEGVGRCPEFEESASRVTERGGQLKNRGAKIYRHDLNIGIQ